MAMRDLVEGECGGANPLMKLATHFTQDTSRHQDGLHSGDWRLHDQRQHGRPFHETVETELVREYLEAPHLRDAPQTFRMQELFHEMQHIERSAVPRFMPSTVQRDMMADIWAEELLSTQPTHGDEVTSDWVEDYSRHGIALPDSHLDQVEPSHMKWADEYLEHALLNKDVESEQSSLQQTAKELLDRVGDPELQNTQFMKYVEKLKDGEVENEVSSSREATDWAEEYDASSKEDNFVDAEAQKWIDQYSLNETDLEYWEKLQTEWDEIASNDADNHHPWLDQYQSEYNKDYQFEEENPFKDHPNPFEEGLTKLKEGDLISAILLFEEAVQGHTDHAEAWQYLGTCQAENEQELLAIRALNKCIDLQPDNLTAHMALAVSYTNESLQTQACDALKAWLQHHPKYKDLFIGNIPPSLAGATQRVSSIATKQMTNEVHDMYITAAQSSPEGDIDADVQIGLGVLFNLTGDYDKAIDCFQTGIYARPTDAQLWNKLGATLANSGKSEEAVESYGHALELNPGFIRSRYNLGISCVNLKAYQEAVEHFLTALNMQRKGENPSSVITTMSDNIWSTLRMSLSLLGRTDLFSAVDKRDLEYLNRTFNMHE